MAGLYAPLPTLRRRPRGRLRTDRGDVDCYSFTAVDFHYILLASLPAHSLTLRPVGLLSRPRRHLSQGFSPTAYPAKPLASYQIKPTTIWVESSSTGDPRRRGALRKSGLGPRSACCQISFRLASASALRGLDGLDHRTFHQNAELASGRFPIPRRGFSRCACQSAAPAGRSATESRYRWPPRLDTLPLSGSRGHAGEVVEERLRRQCISTRRYRVWWHPLHRLGALDGAISTEQFHARIRPDNAMGLARKQWLWPPNRAGVGLTSGDAGA
jgi:hypothetical protein